MGIITAWQSLSMQRKVLSIGAVLLTVSVFGLLFQQTTKPTMALLYSGLDSASAGEVISQLDSLGVPYEVRGETIYTEARRRDILRLELAREGLPRQTTLGYELLDDMNSFAMTSEMFNTAYWRAKEGELARTILALPGVKSARVHIGTANQSSFSRTQSARSASITISTVSGLDKSQASAVQYMTALAVAGLNPKDVAVIDTRYGIVAGPGRAGGMVEAVGGANDRAVRLEQGLLSLLEARVGAGNARVNVTLDIDRNREVVSERIYDPETKVLKSRAVSETIQSSSGTEPSVTVASNLPEGDAGQGGSSSMDRSESSEKMQYEVSEVRRDLEKMPGSVVRMTVAVLLNDVIVRAEDGSLTRTPRSTEELATLQELIAAAVGVDQNRGDVLTLKSLPFEVPSIEDAVQAPGVMQQFLENYLMSSIQAGILGVVVLVLGLFVIKPLLSQKSIENLPTQLAANITPDGSVQLLEGQAGPQSDDPIAMLQSLATEKPDAAANLLMNWLEQDSKTAS